MAAEIIGRATCWNPKCRSKRARVSLSKSGLPVMTCNACHLQIFCRSEVSDEAMRDGLLPPDDADAAPTRAAPELPADVPATTHTARPPVPTPAAPAPAPRLGWGIFA
jgi:hypothetical protein